MTKIIIGIDPGKKTGLAVWKSDTKKFKSIKTCSIIEAMEDVRNLHEVVRFGALKHIYKLRVIFEDARLRTGYFGKDAHLKQQGAGSVKRDCTIWQEFCEYYGIPFETVAPAKGQTKWSAEYFKRVTGWTGRTSEHARDAAVLVFGAK